MLQSKESHRVRMRREPGPWIKLDLDAEVKNNVGIPAIRDFASG